MMGAVFFDPLLPWPAIIALGALALVSCGLAIWRRLVGWSLRGLAAIVLVIALAQPAIQQEDRVPLTDIVILAIDKTASQRLDDRETRTQQAADTLEDRLIAQGEIEVRRVNVPDAVDNMGSQVMGAINDALAEEPRNRIAGVFVLTDGQVHDAQSAPELAAPVHVLLSGKDTDWDRRLIVRNAPAFAILGEPVTLTLRVEDDGASASETSTELDISVDGQSPQRFRMPIGQDIELPLTLPHAGLNVLQFSVPEIEGELTHRNNVALVQINGVRDRLRVLLVSGEPHPGGRTWRNLLKSDSSVDLVHFTILRPPGKQDGVPVTELSLIAFPTRELFLEKIDDFDLIIFDRYQRRGILPSVYLDNVSNYVREGGAVLVAAGPDFASADSIYRSPLAQVLPARPTARVMEQPYRPVVTELGTRHPVTSGLQGADAWGSWLRQIEVEAPQGDVVMTGVDDTPLLILNRVGQGRVALLASDHAWLWSRGYQGGGPQLDLLRRLAHWMMKEPELEEEALLAEPIGQTFRIIRRSLRNAVGDVSVTRPDGSKVDLALTQTAPGRYETTFDENDMGLYRLSEGDLNAVVGLGPSAPKELEATISTSDILSPLVANQNGGIVRMSDGIPNIRTTTLGRPAAGRDWLGITPRKAFETTDIRRIPFLPAWLVLLLASALVLAAWLKEGRR
ncbi:MAG: glutamine amidotransferase [Pseudoprimorskyibacter sp.]|nr:glutamine amidotransferase [Pseudoprimorskyibacter sp.]